MKLASGASLALLVYSFACHSEPKEEGTATSAAKESQVEQDKAAEKPVANETSVSDAQVPEAKPTKPRVLPGSLRFVVVQPEIAVLRTRKKRVDSKQDIKQRERRKQKQAKRIDELHTALSATYEVTRVEANAAERVFVDALTVGTDSEGALPATWMSSERVLVLELAPGTDQTERGGGGGFVKTGSSKVALFSPPSTLPLYLEEAPRGLQVDTAEIHKIVEETP